VVERYVYYPYGGVAIYDASWNAFSTNAHAWKYLFQGGRYDWISFYSFRHRDMDAALGRWAENDPMSFAAGDRNLYRIEANNPVGVTDPSGEWVHLVLLGGAAIFGGIIYFGTPQAAQAPGPGEGFHRPPDFDAGPAFTVGPIAGLAALGLWLAIDALVPEFGMYHIGYSRPTWGFRIGSDGQWMFGHPASGRILPFWEEFNPSFIIRLPIVRNFIWENRDAGNARGGK